MRTLFYLLKEFYGSHVHLKEAKPYYVLSTDDTVQYIFEGKGVEKDVLLLVGLESNEGKGTRSQYEQDDSNMMKGMRVKLTYTFTAVGSQAPVFVTISGLTAEQLPIATCTSGILCLSIKGLCVAGGGMTVGNAVKGYVVFIRNDDDGDKDKKRVRFYCDLILLPFIKGLRRDHDGWQEGMPVTENMNVVSWCDGNNAQIKSIIEAVDTYNSNNIDAMKHNAARTGTEQGADLTHVFRLMRQWLMKLSVADIPEDLHPLKRILVQEFDRLTRSKVLNLPNQKRRALIDFVACIPQAMARSCTANGIRHGFLENGMIDSKTNPFPDFDKMLATCRSNITKEQYKLCLTSFPTLMKTFVEKGHIPDSLFASLGFPPDVNPSGNEVHRLNEGAEGECRQRAKCLTHKYQQRKRTEKLQELEAEKNRVVADERKKVSDILELNKQAEEKLPALDKATLTDFNGLTIKLLKPFILARMPDEKLSSLKKGTVAEAEVGTCNLILFAFEAKDKEIQLEFPTEEEVVVEENLPVEAPDQEQEDNVEPATVFELDSGTWQFKCYEEASKLLSNVSWVKLVADITVHGERSLLEVSEGIKEQSNLLQQLLLQRLTLHVERRVPLPKQKQTAWVFDFVAQNTARMAAIMLLHNHIKKDLKCLGVGRTLLAHVENFLKCDNEISTNLEGTYGYFDTNDHIHIRSGKVTGRLFFVRHTEHSKAAREGKDSQFYRRYPSLEVAALEGRKGAFENLLQVVYFAYDPTSENLDDSISDLFLFNSVCMEKIERIRFGRPSNKLKTEIKKRHMVSYLAELTYDLAICATDNVSESPGFESCGLWKL